MANVLLIGSWSIWRQAFQPVVIVHRQSVALQKKRSAKEVNENATVLQEFD